MFTFDQKAFNGFMSNADSATLDLQEYVAKTGADRAVVTDAVTRFVAVEHRLSVKSGQRGVTFEATGKAFKDADNRRAYLLRLIYNVPRSKTSKRSKTDPVEALIAKINKLTPAQRRRIKAAI